MAGGTLACDGSHEIASSLTVPAGKFGFPRGTRSSFCMVEVQKTVMKDCMVGELSVASLPNLKAHAKPHHRALSIAKR